MIPGLLQRTLKHAAALEQTLCVLVFAPCCSEAARPTMINVFLHRLWERLFARKSSVSTTYVLSCGISSLFLNVCSNSTLDERSNRARAFAMKKPCGRGVSIIRQDCPTSRDSSHMLHQKQFANDGILRTQSNSIRRAKYLFAFLSLIESVHRLRALLAFGEARMFGRKL